MRGMGRIFQRRNSPYWWIAYNMDGQEYRESSRSVQKTVATKLLRQRLADIAAGRHPYTKAHQTRIDVLLESTRRQYVARGGRSVKTWDSHSLPIRAAFGHLSVRDMTEVRLERYQDQRQQAGKTNGTINRELGLLGTVFRLAQRRGLLHRIPQVPRLPEQTVRRGFWEAAEITRFTAALPEDVADMVWFGYYTGWRKGEIVHLRWAAVDMQARTLRLEAVHTKTRHGRLLALVGPLWHIIDRRYHARGLVPLVFHRHGRPLQDLRPAWQAASKTTGIDKLFHDLRRTAVRNMNRAGVPDRVAMDITGHKTRAVYDRYNIVSDSDIRDALYKTYTYLADQPLSLGTILTLGDTP